MKILRYIKENRYNIEIVAYCTVASLAVIIMMVMLWLISPSVTSTF